MRACFMEKDRETGREREKQGGREGERVRERDVEFVQNCLFLKGMTGTLAP